MSGARTFQGMDCKRGHGGLRYVSSSTCVECNREASRAHVEQRRKARAGGRDWLIISGKRPEKIAWPPPGQLETLGDFLAAFGCERHPPDRWWKSSHFDEAAP